MSETKMTEGDWSNYQISIIAKDCVDTLCQNPPERTQDVKKLVVKAFH